MSKNLTKDDFELIRKVYRESESKKEAQEKLAKYFDVSERTVRRYASSCGVNVLSDNIVNLNKVLVYDIETCRVPALVFWSGKQYVNGNQLMEEPRIISISWKWLGKNKVHDLCWDKNQSDEEMLFEFLKEYNNADMVIGQNNDRFDNRWINARGAKFGFEVNTLVKSFDIMKHAKRHFKIPSYSMKYMCKYFDVSQKLEHEGIKMWDKIQFGTDEEKKEYMAKMIEYNRGDIISTEALYYRLRKYFGHNTHFGVMNGEPKFTSPTDGSYNVSLHSTQFTAKGTVQRVMISNTDNVKYKISNRVYMDYLNYKFKNS